MFKNHQSFQSRAGQTKESDINSNSSIIAWRSLRDRGTALLCERARLWRRARGKPADLSVHKFFDIKEQMRVGSGDSFSMALIIRPFFSRMRSSRIALALPGVLTSAVIPQRQIQFALKLEF